MTDDNRSNTWEVVKTLLTLASLAIAVAALWQSREVAKQQDDLANQALAIQKIQFERSAASINFGLIKISLVFPEGQSQWHPELGNQPSELVPIPLDDWNAAQGRYVHFSLANTGTAAVYVQAIGIGSNATDWTVATNNEVFCQAKSNPPTMSNDCPRDLPPASEVEYSLWLSEHLLSEVDEDWQADGFEVCVRLEAYGGVCQRSWVVLPPGFVEAVR